ncbi:P-loop NTPase fold protein [Minisyncoccus archaeiphilus]|uniref:P-loop NTPase fold protein n=1 Tax=Minisyncoccus archaeiphilus TaxID=3238481 RepID=UPI00399C7D55
MNIKKRLSSWTSLIVSVEGLFYVAIFLLFAFLIIKTGVFLLDFFSSDSYLRDYLWSTVIDYGWLWVLMIVLIIYLFNIIDLNRLVQVQRLREKKSYVYYILNGLLYSIAFSAGFFLSTVCGWGIGCFILFIINIFLLLFLVGYYNSIKSRIDFSWYYGPDVVQDEKKDFLGFKNSAALLAEEIRLISQAVEVICLCGSAGAGKSSYLAMTLENLDKNKFLYTYISLSETNEEHDFAKLFNKRWFNTISERYPKVDVNFLMPILDSVFRDFNGGILSRLFSVVNDSNSPIINTSKVDSKTLCKFGGIDTFEEGHWIIVIDELERSKPEEMYRVVETIERFKHMKGVLPINLIFILPFSSDKLNIMEERFLDNVLVYQVNNFLSDNKTVTRRKVVPLGNEKDKESYICSELTRIFGKTIKIVSLRENDQLLSENDKMAYIVNLLMFENPRFIKKCLINIEREKNNLHPGMTSYSPSEMVTLGYILTSSNYLFIFDFLKENLSNVVKDYRGIKVDRPKRIIEEWIKSVYDKKWKEDDFVTCATLIKLVSSSFDYYSRSIKYDVVIMDKTLASPENLMNYFAGTNNESYYSEELLLFHEMKSNLKLPSNLTDEKFVKFIDFLLYKITSSYNDIVIWSEFKKRLILGKNQKELCNSLKKFINDRGIVVRSRVQDILYFLMKGYHTNFLDIIDLIDSPVILSDYSEDMVSWDKLLRRFLNKRKTISSNEKHILAHYFNNNWNIWSVEAKIMIIDYYADCVIKEHDMGIILMVLDFINSGKEVYIDSKDNARWNEILIYLYGIGLRLGDSVLRELMKGIDNGNINSTDELVEIQFNFLNELINSEYFSDFKDRIVDIYGSEDGFYLKAGYCDWLIFIDNIFEKCFVDNRYVHGGYIVLDRFLEILKSPISLDDSKIKRIFAL